MIAGQLWVVNYVQVLKKYASAARNLVLLENSRLLLINAYNYWTCSKQPMCFSIYLALFPLLVACHGSAPADERHAERLMTS